MIIARRAVVGRRGAGIVGTMARTAVVAGTATAVSRGVHNSMDRSAQAKQADQDAQIQAQMQAQQAQSIQSATQPSSGLTGELEKLADMKAKGILNDAEYESAKKKLLG